MAASEPRGRRILITGVSRFLGLRLAKRLESAPGVDLLVGVDLDEPAVPVRGLDYVRADIGSPGIARVLESTGVDTIVHTNISSSPARLGGRSRMKENNVIGTLQLLATAQRSSAVTKVVMKSSTAVYGSSPTEPSVVTEEHAARHVDLHGYGKDCAEAETYARDFGRRRPDVDLVILRTQTVVGPTVRTSMTDYLSLPVVPTALGFDPRLQFLHEEDAVEGIYRALTADVRGIFNVAADGVVYLSKALRLLGRPPAPLILPAARSAAGLLRRFGLVDFPTDQLQLLLFGRVVDAGRAKAAFGFAPRYTTERCVLDMRDGRIGRSDATQRPEWERELLERSVHAADGEMV